MRPETRNQRLKKRASPQQPIPTIVENVENLEFIRKTMWKTPNSTISKRLKAPIKQTLDQAFKQLHSFQHASEQVFCRSLQRNRVAFRENAQLTWDFPTLPPNPCLRSRKCRENTLERPGISTMSKTFTPLFFILIRVFIPVFNNL